MNIRKKSSPMGIYLAPAREKHVIENLLQFYLYDFTEFLDIEMNRQGRYDPYPDLGDFWKYRDEKYPFIITYNNTPAGFALVERLFDSGEGEFYMTEFFIAKRYRRTGLGTWAAYQLFDRLKGRWKVTQVSTNKPAQAFWRKIIGAYTNYKYEERIDSQRGNPSQYFSSRV